MEVYGIDWSIIDTSLNVVATIVSPIIVAIFVYKKWHDQKGKEVISKICEKIILEDINIHNMFQSENKFFGVQEYLLSYTDNLTLFSKLINNPSDIEKIEKHRKNIREIYDLWDTNQISKIVEYYKNLDQSHIEILIKYMKYER